MTRVLWIIGLSFALLVFGGWTVVILIAGITHKHLNRTGLMMLVANGYLAWIILKYLRQKISAARPDPSSADEEAGLP